MIALSALSVSQAPERARGIAKTASRTEVRVRLAPALMLRAGCEFGKGEGEASRASQRARSTRGSFELSVRVSARSASSRAG